MRNYRLTTSLLLLTSFIPASPDRLLPVHALPVDIQKTVWVFVESDADGDTPLYRMYGDTLLTEVISGKRQWYSFRGDSCYYEGEESRLMKLVPTRPIPTSAFGHHRLGSVREESDSGEYCKSYAVEEYGTYESTLPVTGELRFGDGIALKATAVTETRRLSKPSVAGKGEEMAVEEHRRTRWFVDGTPLPAAMQSEERVLVGDSPLKSRTRAYVMSAEELQELASGSLTEDILESLSARLDGDRLLIEGTVPDDITLRIALTDIQGISVLEREISPQPGEKALEISLPPLRVGRYMLAIGTGGSIRKILLTR